MKKLTDYEQQQADKVKQLQRRVFRETIKARIKEPAKQSYKNPFMPSNAHPADLSYELPPILSTMKEKKSPFTKAPKSPQPIIDAETGVPLKFTSSSWNGLEGNLTLTAKSILERGTGKIDIIQANASPVLLSATVKPNPLVSYLEQNGPLTVRMNRNWDAKTGKATRLPQIGDSSEMHSVAQQATTMLAVGAESDSISDSSSDGLVDSPKSIKSPPKLRLEIDSPDRSARSQSPSMLTGRRSPGLSTHHSPGGLRYPPIPLSSEEYSWANSTENWKTLEDRYFHEIVNTITAMEKNKSLTHEPALVNKMKNESVRHVCRRLARMKAVGVYQVAMAVYDEETRELQREKEKAENNMGATRAAKLMEDHQKERQAKRFYIETLQRDNEILFLRKIAELDWLW